MTGNMNVRIKELAEQAWDSLIDEMGDIVSEDGTFNWDFLHAYDQRFAELIVGECARCVEHINMQGGGNLGDVIKNKFGVKE